MRGMLFLRFLLPRLAARVANMYMRACVLPLAYKPKAQKPLKQKRRRRRGWGRSICRIMHGKGRATARRENLCTFPLVSYTYARAFHLVPAPSPLLLLLFGFPPGEALSGTAISYPAGSPYAALHLSIFELSYFLLLVRAPRPKRSVYTYRVDDDCLL